MDCGLGNMPRTLYQMVEEYGGLFGGGVLSAEYDESILLFLLGLRKPQHSEQIDGWFWAIVRRTYAKKLLIEFEKRYPIMAVKKAATQTTKKEAFAFVNIKLTDAELDAFDVVVRDNTLPLEACLEYLCASGKVSLSVIEGGSFSCSLTIEIEANVKRAVSAFASTPVEAIQLLTFKVDKHPDWFAMSTSVKPSRG